MTAYFVHPHAIVESNKVGKGTRIWAFAHVLPGATVGEDCNICDHTFIENDVILGNRVTVKSGVQLWDGITLEDDVFVGPNATFTNDPFPRSKHYLASRQRTLVRTGASIGANATVLPGLSIGQFCMVGAGAVVTHDVPPFAIVTGNPARIVGYVATTHDHQDTGDAFQPAVTKKGAISVEGVHLYDLPLFVDLRGSLTFAERDQALPFVPQRYFVVFDVSSHEIRGEHAHRECHQLLTCLRGSCSVVLDDSRSRAEIALDRPNLALHVPPMLWTIQYKFSPDAILLVLASEIYAADDYIRDYDLFLKETNQTRQP